MDPETADEPEAGGGVLFRFDDRERSLIDAFRRKSSGAAGVRGVVTERLPMGDVILEPPPADGGPRVVVERKVLTDLVASVFDGRLAEQHQRLLAYQAEAAAVTGAPPVWIVLLVEGTLTPATFVASAGADGADARYRLCVGTQLRLAASMDAGHRRLFLRTSGEDESAVLLLSLYRACTGIGGGDGGNGPLPPLPGRSVRGSAFVRQLTATAGVSVRRARCVETRFTNLYGLTRAITEDAAAAEDRTVALLRAALGGGKVVADRLMTDLGLAAFIPTVPAPRRKKKSPRKKRGRTPTPAAASVSPPKKGAVDRVTSRRTRCPI
jgi:hypothetical protein